MTRRSSHHDKTLKKGLGSCRQESVRQWLDTLIDLRKKVNYEAADFDGMGKRKIDGLTVTEFIRQTTTNHREAWVNVEIDNMIAQIRYLLGE